MGKNFMYSLCVHKYTYSCAHFHYHSIFCSLIIKLSLSYSLSFQNACVSVCCICWCWLMIQVWYMWSWSSSLFLNQWMMWALPMPYAHPNRNMAKRFLRKHTTPIILFNVCFFVYKCGLIEFQHMYYVNASYVALKANHRCDHCYEVNSFRQP